MRVAVDYSAAVRKGCNGVLVCDANHVLVINMCSEVMSVTQVHL